MIQLAGDNGLYEEQKNESICNVHCALWSDIPNQERSSSEASTTGRAELRKSQEETPASFSCNSCSLTSKNCFSKYVWKILCASLQDGRDGDSGQASHGALHHDPQVHGQDRMQLANQRTHLGCRFNGAVLETIWSQQILEGVTSSHCHWKWMTSNKGELKNVEVTISSIWQKLFKRKPPLWTGIVDEVQRWFLVLSGSGFGHLSVSLSVLSFQA